MKKTPTVHIINHTHWDREWFLTSIYTRQWIPNLIDRIQALADENPQFRYLFDGQTLVIEDLLEIAPEYEPKVQALVQAGNLIIGPYYCQPDWQLTAGESLLRNLEFGLKDTEQHDGQSSPGWLVDTFGHISQSPQIHRLFGIDSAYVWRGVPQLEPFFDWVGADGQTIFGVDLFGGYRNLYGVTHAPEIANKRLVLETERLAPFYPLGDVPLFDGYDLEDNPEDPLRFFEENGRFPTNQFILQESTSRSFVETVRAALNGASAPATIEGELISGKYGATFPGTYSARTYQKVLAYDCETLLYKQAEPLASLTKRPFPTNQFEALSRILLQNAVHDCICGVSIDIVHEKMDVLYRHVFEETQTEIDQSLTHLLADFANGDYAVGSSPMRADVWVAQDDALVRLQTNGLGAWPVTEKRPLSHPSSLLTHFNWQNEHYTATLDSHTGIIQLGDGQLGQLLLFAEAGDSYSDETGALLGKLQPKDDLILEAEAEGYRVIRFDGQFTDEKQGLTVTAGVHITFDDSPLIRWAVDLDSRGVNFRVEMRFETAVTDHNEQVLVNMPFDHVRRPMVDTDLLPRKVEGNMADIFMGQRELNEVRTYPMHEFVGLTGQGRSVAVFSKGARSYQAFPNGTLSLTLRRSVEWVTKANLENRVGDAGPFFYVPDARCERQVRHEIAFYAGKDGLESESFLQINDSYHNPPTLVNVAGEGTKTAISFPAPAVPMSSLTVKDGQRIGRFYNPTGEPLSLGASYKRVDVEGSPAGETTSIQPKQVVQLVLPIEPAAAEQRGRVMWQPTGWRVGENKGQPETAVLQQLEAQMVELEDEVARLEKQLAVQSGTARLKTEHLFYIAKRELYEYKLTVYLNEQKLQRTSAEIDHLFESDPGIVEIGTALNQLRIKRRIFDYVAKVL